MNQLAAPCVYQHFAKISFSPAGLFCLAVVREGGLDEVGKVVLTRMRSNADVSEANSSYTIQFFSITELQNLCL